MTPRNHRAEPTLYKNIHGFLNAGEPGLSGFSNGSQHEVILQALERYLIYGTEKEPVKIFYGVENFTGTEPAWNQTPAIFVENGEHPDLTEFFRDPETALKKVNGRYAGTLENSQVIPAPGQPRLKSLITFSDPEVQALYEAGELALSTALHSRASGGRLQGKVIPNHVLLFRPGKTQPRDMGSMFLNTDFSESDATGGDTLEKLDKILSDFSNNIKSFMNGGPGPGKGEGDGGEGENREGDNMDPEITEKLKLANTALERAIEGKDQELKTLKEDLKNTKEALETFRNAESDRIWNGLKNTTIPPGLIDSQEREKELRALYNTDRDAFYQKIIAVKNKAPNKDKEGDEFTNSDKFKKLVEVNQAWDQATGETVVISK